MPTPIALQAVPNQSFSVQLDGHRYDLTIKSIGVNTTVATVLRDGVEIVSNTRLVSNRLMMKYRYLEGTGGNFMLVTGDIDTLPDYSQFGTTQALYYLTAAELASMRAGT